MEIGVPRALGDIHARILRARLRAPFNIHHWDELFVDSIGRTLEMNAFMDESRDFWCTLRT